MNTALWIVQILAALAFGMAGLAKLTQPYDKLRAQMKWVDDFSPNMVKGIGALELLGAIGLIIPALTGTLPWLTPVAAVGLVVVMLGAMVTHFRRQEMPMIGINFVLLLLAAFVAYGRWMVVPL